MIAAIVLAAGGSRRMHGPKQLIQLDGKTLLRRAAESAVGSGAAPVIVVLGSEAGRLREELEGLDLDVVVNSDWESGMAVSLRLGLARVPAQCAAALITVCDQPLVKAENLKALISLYRESGSPIAAAAYSGTLGVPAVFDRSLFEELNQLTGDIGARRILNGHRMEAAALDLPDAAIDLDTPLDLNSFSAKQH